MVLLVEALVKGFSGETEPASKITEYEIAKLASEAGSRLPVVKTDPGLPQAAPVFDFEEMKRRNTQRLVDRAKKVG